MKLYIVAARKTNFPEMGEEIEETHLKAAKINHSDHLWACGGRNEEIEEIHKFPHSQNEKSVVK